MFGSPPAPHPSDEPLALGLPVLEAIASGRSAEQRQAAGSSIDPWIAFVDTSAHPYHGEERVARSSMPIAVAVVRQGDAEILRGMASHPSFYGRRPRTESGDRMEHSERPLPVACACEALARGRFDMLDILLEGAKAALPLSRQADRGYDGGCAEAFLRLDPRDAAPMFAFVARSKRLTAAERVQAVQWIGERLRPDPGKVAHSHYATILGLSGPDPLDQWADAIAEKGCEANWAAALALGWIPQRRHVMAAAQTGCFDAAVRMAPIALADAPGPTSSRPQQIRGPVCHEMAHSLIACLERIANEHLEWAPPASPSRESTWASFLLGRENLHRGILLALGGAFDLPGDSPTVLTKAKSHLASAGRALASLSTTLAPDVDPLDVERVAPGATATADELIFLARLGHSSFATALAAVSKARADSFLAGLLALHAQSSKEADLATHNAANGRGLDSGQLESLLARRAHLEAALFHTHDSGRSTLSKSGRSELDDYLGEYPHLLAQFEARSLGMNLAAPAKPSRGPLRT